MNTKKEEKIIHELMSKSSAEMPFSDFEDKLMGKIYQETERSRSFLKNIKLSWLFFIIGTFFGLFLSIIAGQLSKIILGFPSQRILLVIQIIFAILLLTQFSNLFELTKKRNDNN